MVVRVVREKVEDGSGNYKRGQYVESQGVYVGIWRNITDRDGQKLAGKFNIWAAPQDTRFLVPETDPTFGKLARYDDDVKRIASLRGICGNDGVMLADDAAIYDAVRTGNHVALAAWHMPVKDLVNGSNIYFQKDVQPDNLYAHKDKGALKSTFTDRVGSDFAPCYYWTASRFLIGPWDLYGVGFTDGVDCWAENGDGDLSSRAIRLVARKPKTPAPAA